MLFGKVKRRVLDIFQDDHITSGSVGMPIRFIFDDEWTGLTKVAFFKTTSIAAVADIVDDECIVPSEVLVDYTEPLWISVAGIGEDFYIPTAWWRGIIERGAEQNTYTIKLIANGSDDITVAAINAKLIAEGEDDVTLRLNVGYLVAEESNGTVTLTIRRWLE